MFFDGRMFEKKKDLIAIALDLCVRCYCYTFSVNVNASVCEFFFLALFIIFGLLIIS